MSALTQFVEAARSDRPVYISDVRDAFRREGTRPFHFHVTLYDDSVRRFALKAPRCDSAEESAFVAAFLDAMFELMCEGAKRIVPDIELAVADEGLANTGLMKQLAAQPDYTVAQFAQAVGAVYYACVGLL